MKYFRVIVPNYNGERIVGQWMRDVDFIILNICAVWVERGVTFTIEFKE